MLLLTGLWFVPGCVSVGSVVRNSSGHSVSIELFMYLLLECVCLAMAAAGSRVLFRAFAPVRIRTPAQGSIRTLSRPCCCRGSVSFCF